MTLIARDQREPRLSKRDSNNIQFFRKIKKCMQDEKVFGSTRPVLPVQLNADF